MAKKIDKKLQNSVRFKVVDTLVKAEQQHSYANLLVASIIDRSDWNSADKHLFTELIYGTISRKLTLNFYIDQFVTNPKKVDPWVRILLQTAFYQMIYLDKVPDYAVIDSSVEIAKAKGNPGIGKFVNGVLRNLQRKGTPEFTQIKDAIVKLSIQYSIPLWLMEKLVNQLGIESADQLGASLFTPSRVSARVDTRVISREQAIDELAKAGIEMEESQVSPFGIVGEKGFLAGTELFSSGKITVQDESSMLVAQSMNIQPGDQVLDACAAPGGKTTHIATFLDAEQGGKVTALDLHAHKVRLIQQNGERLNVSSVIDAKTLDARKVAEIYEDESFDRILVDAPCSGLGLIRRKPDIKYYKTAADFESLAQIQLAILESVASKVKIDGSLTYSTCTIVEDENANVVAKFLNKHPEFVRMDIPVSEYLNSAVSDQALQIYPHQFGTDGFYICCLKRVRK